MQQRNPNILIFVLLLCVLMATLSTHEVAFGSDEEVFPLIVNLYPQNPTDKDWIVIEGFLNPSPPIQEFELVDYNWISDNELEVNINFIPGDFVPPKQEREYLNLRLEPLKIGEYTVVFKEEGKELHRLDFTVEKGITKFPIDVQLIPTQVKGTFQVEITGEFPSGGFSLMDKNLTFDVKQILVNLQIEESNDPAIAVIVPFKEVIGKITLSDGFYDMSLLINGRNRLGYPIQIQNGQILNRIDPNPAPDQTPGPFQAASLNIEPFESNVGDTVQVLVTGYFPSTAYSIEEEETIRRSENIIFIIWKVKQEEIGDTVLVPVEKKYEFTDLKPGNYVFLLQVNNRVVTENKCHVLGSILEPTKELPFQAELRFEIPGRDIKETGFLLVGKFPTPGYTFTEKNVEVVDNQITVTTTIKAPSDPSAEVITPFLEKIGSLLIPDLWERPYFVTTIVNGVTLDPLQLGGSSIDTPFSSYPWNWIDVKIDTSNSNDLEADVYLTGEFPTPGYQFSKSTVEIVGNQINVWVDMIPPSNAQSQENTPFMENIGRVLIDDYSTQTYELNIFVNGNQISNRQIGGDTVITPVLDWIYY